MQISRNASDETIKLNHLTAVSGGAVHIYAFWKLNEKL